MLYRQAKPAEFESVFCILRENARWLFAKGILQWPLDWLESIQSEIQSSIDSGLFYVADIDQKIAAVIELKSEPEELWENDESPCLYIHKIAISRQYSNKGLGLNMLDFSQSQAIEKNAKYLRLDCVAHNKQLRNYYESYGFNLKGVVESGKINFALYEYKIQS